MKNIIAYTDGSAITTGEKLGGIGAYIQYDDKEIFISKGYKNTTISRMEMLALFYVIKKIPINLQCKLTVYSDSQFVVNSFNKGWLENWKRDNFVGRSNSDLWKQIVYELDIRKEMYFEIIHTRGHLKDLNNPIVLGNSIADALADYKRHQRYETDLGRTLNYYYHAESGSLWSSYYDFEYEMSSDGCTDPISYETAIEVAKLEDYKFNKNKEVIQ